MGQVTIWFADPNYSGVWCRVELPNIYTARRVYDALKAAGFKMESGKP